jgi:cytochrome c
MTAGAAAGVTVAMLSSLAASRQVQPAPSIWSGVYTADQAERGFTRYLESCASCHRDDLQGDSAEEIPGLATATFVDGWSGRTVKDLVDTIRRTMPGDRPGSLEPRAYVELAAFILRSNRFPGGPEPLPSDPALVPPIVIQRSR